MTDRCDGMELEALERTIRLVLTSTKARWGTTDRHLVIDALEQLSVNRYVRRRSMLDGIRENPAG